MRPSFMRAFVVIVTATLVLLSLPSRLLAATTLGAVRVDANTSGGAQVTVSFSGGVPAYHVVGAGTTETAVIFDGAILGPQAPPTVAGAGPLVSASISTTGTSSSVALHLSAPTGVRVRAAGNSVILDIAAPPAGALTNPLGAPPAAPAVGGLGPETDVIPLKYADVSEIAGVLVAGSNIATNDTFTPIQTNIGTSSLNGSFGGVSGGFSQPQTPQTFGGGPLGQGQGVAQRVNDNIAIDRRLNAIILSGTPDVIAGLKAIIDKLDIPVQSVILETQIVELSDNAARNVGFDLSPDGSGIIVNAERGTTGGTGTTSSGGLTIGTQQMASSSAFLQAALYAQISSGNGRVIAKPRILAQSGQQASILTGDAIPIFTNIAVQNVGSAQQVNYVNVGVNLQIQPRVSSDGFVTSHIYSEVSSVTSIVNGAPQISQRTASTIATVRDGDSFVIGGLLQDNEIRNLTKLPFIGDIPLIGVFFRHVNTSHSQTNLYIVVTPHVVGGAGVAPAIGPLATPTPLPQLGPPAAPPASQASPAPLTPPSTVKRQH